MALRLMATSPFAFHQSVAFLQGFVPCAGDHACTAATLTTGGFVEERPWVAQVRVGADDPCALDAAVHWPETPGADAAVAERLTAFLSLADDLGPLYAAARHDPPFARVVADLHGLHHVRFPTPFEAACWAALSQRTRMGQARREKDRLVTACGQRVEVAGQPVALFPTPARVRAHPLAVQDALSTERKVRTVLAAAEAFAEPGPAGAPLAHLDDADLYARLRAIWGFGPWAAEFVLLRGFGRMGRLPTLERRLRAAVPVLYTLGSAEADESTLRRLSAPYAPLAGYWAHYIRVWAGRQQAEQQYPWAGTRHPDERR